MSVFSKVDALNPKRSTFDLSHTVDFDCKIGECIPFMCEELVPGDTFNISNITKVRFQPTVAPISDELTVKMDYFFVPNRLVFNEELDGNGNSWEKFIMQVPTSNDTPADVQFAVPMPKWNVSNGKNGVYSLWDYLGLPVGVSPSGKSAPTDLIKRGYNLIWNEYYRDENLQSEVDIITNEDILWSNVSKDYFTSAFTQRQRGPATGLPVYSVINGDYLPFRTEIDKTDLNFRYLNFTGASESTAGLQFSDLNPDGTRNWSMTNSNGNVVINKIGGVNTDSFSLPSHSNKGSSLSIDIPTSEISISSTGFDISDLRLARQVQMWQERSLRGGVRYTEFLHSFFGCNPRDDRLQRPEYIAGVRNPVIVQDVLQTSQTTDTSAQATESGHLISADGQSVRKYSAVEYGFLFGIFRIVPKIKYMNGINRQYLRNTPFDYYFPTFAHLSEQGIYNEEIFAVDSEDDNLEIWGFQGIYNEMRYKPNKVLAGLRDSNGFLFWTMGRKFSSLPNLNGNFISTRYMQDDFMRIFQITDANLTRPCIVHIWNGLRAKRPMPYMAIPM